ncbi:MAG TPA: hypothetical protein DDZ88_30000 [Verrucomicrobiales bacterium]|nr:hypothetical protein [Verrucomicrobiales bacterium]
MKFGEFKIIGKGLFAAMVTPMDERHPDIPLVLIGDDAKYLYFSYMLRNGQFTKETCSFLNRFELSPRFAGNREFYLWLRETVALRELTCIDKEPGAEKGKKGKGAR